eukprot:6204885-Pleurochrysis_carterae.AAC.1
MSTRRLRLACACIWYNSTRQDGGQWRPRNEHAQASSRVRMHLVQQHTPGRSFTAHVHGELIGKREGCACILMPWHAWLYHR